MNKHNLIAWSLAVVTALSGCDRRAEAGGPGASTNSSAPRSTAAPPAQAATAAPQESAAADSTGSSAVSTSASPVARIVFIGKENACACTRRSIDASWSALQEALGGAAIPVERLTIDGQPSAVEPYRQMQAFFGLPAMYFLDVAGGLVGQLQGEVTADQVRAILFP